MYRRDRATSKRGGGVLFAVTRSLASTLVLSHTSQEILIVSVNGIMLMLCYRPPKSDVSNFVKSMREVFLSPVIAAEKNKPICVLGDFNFPDITWSQDKVVTSVNKHRAFIECKEEFNFTQLNNTVSNKHNNILDLVFSNFPQFISGISKSNVDFTSDHVLSFCIFNSVPQHKTSNRWCYNYKNADVNCIKNALNCANLHDLILSAPNVNVAWKNWHATVSSVIDKHVPKVQVRVNNHPQWFDSEVEHVRNKERTARRKATGTNSLGCWHKYRTLRNHLRSLVRRKYSEFIQNLDWQVKTNRKRFWNFSLSRIRYPNRYQVQLSGATCQLTTPLRKLPYLISTSHLFSMAKQTAACSSANEHNSALHDILVSEIELENIISYLDTNKACGPDGIPPIFIKCYSSELLKSLCLLINRSLQEGTVPSDWLCANIFPHS